MFKDRWINDLISWKQNEKWKDCMVNFRKRLQEGNTPFILHNDQDSDGANNLKDLKNIIIKSMPVRMEDLSFEVTAKPVAEYNTFVPRQLTMVGGRTKVGILGDHHPGLNSCDFFVQRCLFACWKVNSLAIDGWCGHTCRTPHFHMYRHSTEHTAQITCVHGSRGLRALDGLCAKTGHSSTRHVSPCASQHTEHQHKFFLFNLSCVAVVTFSEPRPVVHVSNYPL